MSFEFLSALSNCLRVLSIQVAPKGNTPSMNPKWPPRCGTISTVCGLDWNLSTGRTGDKGRGERVTKEQSYKGREDSYHSV